MNAPDILTSSTMVLVEPSRCFGCGSQTLDRDRGWVQNMHNENDPRTWWLCNNCLDLRPSLQWSEDGPRITAWAGTR